MEFAFDKHSFMSAPLEALLAFSDSYDVFTILNANGHNGAYDLLGGFGAKKILRHEEAVLLTDEQWKFGYVGYDVKNRIEKLHSGHTDRIKAPELFMFIPEIVIAMKGNAIRVFGESQAEEAAAFKKLQASFFGKEKAGSVVELKESITREEYLKKIQQIKQHIRQGDIYEMNFCMEFFASAELSPAHIYLDLNAISEAPFSFFARYEEVFAIGSSPERFLQKKGSHLITQPIKGTAPRSTDATEDRKAKEKLHASEKERNENVMIVDVSRNDLSRVAKKGSVKVDELFGVYSFRQVHQMISTVSCEIAEQTTFAQILHATFPPASMTGAPKIRAMQIIEEQEQFKRSIYSGMLGYISPAGDFDFNVVIRTILYNQKEKQVSYAVGSAITDKCKPEEEYEECLLKAAAMRKVLEKESGEQPT